MDVLGSGLLSKLVFETEPSLKGSGVDYVNELITISRDILSHASKLPTGIEYSIFSTIQSNEKKIEDVNQKVSFYLNQCLSDGLPFFTQKNILANSGGATVSACYELLFDYIDTLLLRADRAIRVCEENGLEARIQRSSASKSNENISHVETQEDGAQDVSERQVDYCRMVDSFNTESIKVENVDKALWQSCFNDSTTCEDEPICHVKYKFGANVPSTHDLKRESDNSAASVTQTASVLLPSSQHLYQDEIHGLHWELSTTPEGQLRMFDLVTPQLPVVLDSTPLVWVRYEEDLKNMVQELKSQSCIALDVEHHNQHSFRGVTCLIQISTRQTDYLIDPLYIRKELWTLNEITANPGILKVVHGGFNDVVWLQRDFSIYLVNMFDTSIAASVLHIPGGCSLGNLLLYYCKVSTKKKYQLADWRQRPLTKGMIRYARLDSHYLLYIHDRLRNDLLIQSGDSSEEPGWKMNRVLQESRLVSLRQYPGPTCKDTSTLRRLLSKKFNFPLDPVSYNLLVNLLDWREKVARSLDESPTFILSNPLICLLVLKKPRSWKEFQRNIHPINPILYHFAQHLLEVIQRTLFNNTQSAEKLCSFASLEKDANMVEGLQNSNNNSSFKRFAGNRENSCFSLQDELLTLGIDDLQSIPLMEVYYQGQDQEKFSRYIAMSGIRYNEHLHNGEHHLMIADGLEKFYGLAPFNNFKLDQKQRLFAKAVGQCIVMQLRSRYVIRDSASSTQDITCCETSVKKRLENIKENSSSPTQLEPVFSGGDGEIEILSRMRPQKRRGKRKTFKCFATSSLEQSNEPQIEMKSSDVNSLKLSGLHETVERKRPTGKKTAHALNESCRADNKRKRVLLSSHGAAFLPVTSIEGIGSQVSPLATTIKFYGNVAASSNKIRGIHPSKKKRHKFGR